MPYINKEDKRAYDRKWMRKRRSDWIASQGGCCVKCGGTERLEVDHIDPAKKSFNPNLIWSRVESVRLGELAKCQVLCHDCHLAKTNEPKPLVHGTTHGYNRRKCRCKECRAWNTARVRRQREARF